MWNPFSSSTASGSAFNRLGQADVKLSEAEGKLSAIEDSISVKRSKVAALVAEANKKHSLLDSLDSEIESLNAIL